MLSVLSIQAILWESRNMSKDMTREILQSKENEERKKNQESEEVPNCQYFPACSGCSFIGKSKTFQKDLKLSHFKGLFYPLFPEFFNIDFMSMGSWSKRVRLDFVWENGRLGLYSHEKKQILDLSECSQLSSELQKLLTEFRNISWPIQKGSIRLRVSPDGIGGIWLDFANLDIKKILDNSELLQKITQMGFVEVGQKFKRIAMRPGNKFGLLDPEPNPWFYTFCEGKKIDLYSYVGSFTQPSFIGNELIIKTMLSYIGDDTYSRAVEFGSGIGNLSLPLLGRGMEVMACELVREFSKLIKLSLVNAGLWEKYKSKIKFHTGDFREKKKIEFKENDILILNPPRSGVGKFLSPLLEGPKPSAIFYMSCFPESFIQDSQTLQTAGFRPEKMSILDQFPQTTHYEILSYWKR